MATTRISDLPAASVLAGTELIEVSRLSTDVEIEGTTISAQASDNSFNDSANGFVAAGFEVGNRVNVAGFTGNVANNLFVGTITALTAGKMTIGGTDGDVIVDDAAGESVTITKWISARTTAQEIANLGGGGGGSSFPPLAGNANKVLAVNTDEDDVEWVAQAGGGGGGGNLVKLAEWTGDGSATSHTFSGIDQGYDDLILVIDGSLTAGSSTIDPGVTVNGLSTSIYSLQRTYSGGTVVNSNNTDLGSAITPLAALPSPDYSSTETGLIEMVFSRYADTDHHKQGWFTGRQPRANDYTSYTLNGVFNINDVAAITSVSIDFVQPASTKTRVALYGRGGAVGVGSGGGGGACEVIERIDFAGGETSFSFDAIPQTYSRLEVEVFGRMQAAGSPGHFTITVNGDTSSIYDYQRHFSDGTTQAADEFLGQANITNVCQLPGTSFPAGQAAGLLMQILGYTSNTFHKAFAGTGVKLVNSTSSFNQYSMQFTGGIRTTTPVTSIEFPTFSGGAEMAAGSYAVLRGYK